MVSIVTILLTGWSVIRIPVGERFFCFPKCPDWLWGPPSLLFNGYQCSSLGLLSMKLTTDILLVLRLECNRTSAPLMCLHNGGSENFTFALYKIFDIYYINTVI